MPLICGSRHSWWQGRLCGEVPPSCRRSETWSRLDPVGLRTAGCFGLFFFGRVIQSFLRIRNLTNGKWHLQDIRIICCQILRRTRYMDTPQVQFVSCLKGRFFAKTDLEMLLPFSPWSRCFYLYKKHVYSNTYQINTFSSLGIQSPSENLMKPKYYAGKVSEQPDAPIILWQCDLMARVWHHDNSIFCEGCVHEIYEASWLVNQPPPSFYG